MRFEAELAPAVFLKRWQRFLATVALATGEEAVVHVPNSGRLTGVLAPGRRCFLLPTPWSKLKFRLELVEVDGELVGINTQRANALALEALEKGLLALPGLAPSFGAKGESSPVPGARLDWELRDPLGSFWVEVKNITWVEGEEALFPDGVTARGTKHLHLLTELAAAGQRAAVVYVVQRPGARQVRAAGEVDSDYAEAAHRAQAAGVVFAAVNVRANLLGLFPSHPLPVVFRSRAKPPGCNA